ncbi:DUF2812 domain-containing protein [Hornefia butyriciproducens]|uniref:DUF2812 domain-containing protein n=1 Tax=Hornefia butyriciproducens TaxID=2652293 RepID=A0A6L5Y3J7_9FIRM|nr:DUF2812 domain-containing protein [Hornefia butyriciproducens]MDY5463975.1 DUF2812 domain-containing protein [Hornefia butyriciproducens]MST51183.1 DUF2812 domain-containing protein [Hornefia butyriciproducens]
MRKDRKYVFETLMYRDFERRESYYTDMAAEGWYLKKYGLCVTVFERGEPEPGRRYRLLPKKGTPDPEKRELFLAGGWKQVEASGSWDIYYTDDSSAEELFTDGISYRSYMADFSGGELLWLIIFLVTGIWMVYGNLSALLLFKPGTWMMAVDEVGICVLAAMPVFLICSGGLWIDYFITSAGIIRRIKHGTVRHGLSWKRKTRIGRIATVLILVSLAVVLAGSLSGRGDLSRDELQNFHAEHPVQLEEIDPSANRVIQRCIRTNVWEDPNAFEASVDSNVLFRNKITVSYTVGDGKPPMYHPETGITDFIYNQMDYQARYYEARSERIARIFLEGVISEDIRSAVRSGDLPSDTDMNKIQRNVRGVDYAGYYGNADTAQHLYLRRGRYIEIASYSGMEDSRYLLSRDLDKFVKNLQRRLL